MIFGSNVAPKRRVIAKKYVPWTCECRVFAGTGTRYDPTDTLPAHTTFWQEKKNPGYLVRCIDCGAERDK